MGTLIVKSGRPIAFGLNKPGSGFVKDRRYNKSRNGFPVGVHSELDAILNASGSSLEGAIAYVSVITPGNNFALSKPCYRCHALLKEKGIKKVIYHNHLGEELVMEL